MAKSWTCDICKSTVSELGAFVKISMRQYAHLGCVEKVQYELGVEAGREQIAQEQADKLRKEQEQAREQEARERAEAERRAEVQERERTNRIIAAKNNPLPPKLEPKNVETKPEEPRPDRFKLLDIE